MELDDFIRTLKRIGDLHSPSLEDHETRTRDVTLSIGERLNMLPDRLKLLGQAAEVHDWGKIFLREEILNKPDKLNKAERTHIQEHVIRGVDSLELIPEFPPEIKDTILLHHEHWDGRGYPKRLAGLDIPLFPRIVCIGDVWDALVNTRPYRAAFTFDQALSEMNRCSAWFDPKLLAIFFSVLRKEDYSRI